MKKFFILIIVLLFSFGAFCQVNLVPNPSFELHSACPNITGQWYLSTSWYNCNGNIGPGLWGTPDYYNTCGIYNPTYNTIPPNTCAGNCFPNTGGAMMGLVCYDAPYPNYREYISAKLTCTLNPGSTYTVSFYINAGTAPLVKYSSSHFGVYLSSGQPVQSGYLPILVTPQYEITSLVTNTTWVQHTFTFTPATPIDYITLGCFRNDASVTITMTTPSASQPYSNYFIDDISVTGSTNIPVNFATQSSCLSGSTGAATVTPVAPGAYTYSWLPSNQSGQSISNLSPGTYTVNVSDACASDSKTVNIAALPSPSLTVNSISVCASAAGVLTANASGGVPGYSYLWTGGATTPTLSINTNSNAIVTCSVTDSQGCEVTSTASVSISAPGSTFTYTLDPCIGKLTISNINGPGTYYWDFGDGATSNLNTPSHTYTTSGTYTVTLMSGAGTCTALVTKTVNVTPGTPASFSLTNTLCDSTVSVTNTSTGATGYLWNFGDGSTSIAANPSTHIYNNSGTYSVMLITNPATSCADTLVQTVSVVKSTNANFTFGSSSCTKSISTVNSSSLASSYLWQFGDGSTSTLTNPSYSYGSTGTYSVTLYTNPGTTCADTLTKMVMITNPPSALFSFTTDLCSANVLFTNNSQNASSYLWTFGDVKTSTETSPSHTYGGPGSYAVTLTADPGSPCSSTTTQTVNVSYSSVYVDFNYTNPDYSYDSYFTALTAGASTFIWDFGDGSMSDEMDPVHTFSLTGDFNVCMQASNSIGCSDLICKTIHIDPDWTLYIPNTFTPNADGLNDIFFAEGTNISSFKMRIFDRWGEEIFSSDDINKGWDGTYNNKPAQEDVYVWKVTAVDYRKESHDLTGHVSIIR